MNEITTPFIDSETLAAAREEAARSRRPLMELLEERLELSPERLIRTLAERFRLTALDWTALGPSTAAFEAIPYPECARHELVPVRADDGSLHVVLSNPYGHDVFSFVETRVHEDFDYALARRSDVLAYLGKHEESIRAMDHAMAGVADTKARDGQADELSLQAISENESPVVKLVSSTLYDALKSRASDIHFEANGSGLSIKYRIDGVLVPIQVLEGNDLGEQIISRIKVMAELDIAERRVPQDGRFRVSNKGREIDFRVSIMPSIYGEDAVVRILDKRYLADQVRGLRLDDLGLTDEMMRKLRWLAAEPYGMLLVTGPTGSGKTTTLYAVISEVNQGLDKIITIEDPVEYQLPGVLQIPVNEKKGLTFARGLRSILRHDPDRIMVGEIRDPETAEIAVQSALTGHLVYTTVHANNVVDVIGRLLHMKIDAYSFVSAVNGVLAQRLMRLNCTHCAVAYDPAPELLHDSRLPAAAVGWRFMRGTGCAECRGTGYRGRRAIGELLVLNDELRELIVDRAGSRLFKEKAREHGTRFLRDAALDLVQHGESTLEEANRVTFVA
jgi:general secretion pathway protein E